MGLLDCCTTLFGYGQKTQIVGVYDQDAMSEHLWQKIDKSFEGLLEKKWSTKRDTFPTGNDKPVCIAAMDGWFSYHPHPIMGGRRRPRLEFTEGALEHFSNQLAAIDKNEGYFKEGAGFCNRQSTKIKNGMFPNLPYIEDFESDYTMVLAVEMYKKPPPPVEGEDSSAGDEDDFVAIPVAEFKSEVCHRFAYFVESVDSGNRVSSNQQTDNLLKESAKNGVSSRQQADELLRNLNGLVSAEPVLANEKGSAFARVVLTAIPTSVFVLNKGNQAESDSKNESDESSKVKLQ